MSPHIRRLVYVVSYEVLAIVLTTVGLVVLGFGGGSSGAIAVAASAIALAWNYVWTTLFEAWEARQPSRRRTVRRRIAHAVGFEGGLAVILVPLLAWWLEVSLVEAFILDLGLLAFFLVYTFVFAWIFDVVVPRRDPQAYAARATRP